MKIHSKYPINAWPYAVLFNGKTGALIDGEPTVKANVRSSNYDYFNKLLNVFSFAKLLGILFFYKNT